MSTYPEDSIYSSIYNISVFWLIKKFDQKRSVKQTMKELFNNQQNKRIMWGQKNCYFHLLSSGHQRKITAQSLRWEFETFQVQKFKRKRGLPGNQQENDERLPLHCLGDEVGCLRRGSQDVIHQLCGINFSPGSSHTQSPYFVRTSRVESCLRTTFLLTGLQRFKRICKTKRQYVI